MKTSFPSAFCRKAYTLIELLAAGSVIAVGITAAVSLSGSLMLQEEFAWRVAVTRNYQENMSRLWQLGLSPAEVNQLMPTQSANPVLAQILYGSPAIVENGTTDVGGAGLATMEIATCAAAANISQDIRTESSGATHSLRIYRPSLPTELRP